MKAHEVLGEEDGEKRNERDEGGSGKGSHCRGRKGKEIGVSGVPRDEGKANWGR